MSARVIAIALAALVALSGCAQRHEYETVINPWSDIRILAPGGEGEPGMTAEPAVAAAGPAGVGVVSQAAGMSVWGDPVVEPFVSPKAVADSDPPYMLDTGDRLRVFVYGQPNLSRIYVVDAAGFITVPLIGQVRTRGFTTYDVEHTIRGLLARQYVKDPSVSVDIAATRPFYILGEVRTAGQYSYVPGMTVLTAVAIAGGFSERAYERKVQITRRINGLIDKLEVPADYVILPGDTVYVRERWF